MPFDSQQFLQELQAIMQQQRPPRPDSYSAADSAVQIHPYMEGKEPRHAFPTFLDDHQVILFGGGIRIFDTQKGKFVQTISRLRNAEIALSPTKSKIFLANATAKAGLSTASPKNLISFSIKKPTPDLPAPIAWAIPTLEAWAR